MTYPSVKTYGKIIAVFCAVELLSWLAYTGPRSELYVTIVLLLAAIMLAWKRPVWLAYTSVGELIVGSKGYLFFLQFGQTKISIRMLLFAILLAATIPYLRREWKSLRTSIFSRTFLLFIGWLILSIIIAILRHNSLSNIYTDANAFIYLALLPAWWIIIRHNLSWRTNILSILLAGATVIGLKSWLMVLVFGQDITNIRHVYSWIRNTGVGEITFINNNMYRIFFQSQIYSLIALCVTLVIFVREKTPRWFFIPMAMSALGVYISLSRSFWLGFGVFMFIFVGWSIHRRAWSSLVRLSIALPLGIFAWAMLVWALSFPAFSLAGGRANAVATRLNATGSADAATSRTNQIQPLLKSIANHPVIGSGFGTNVTYLSTDPRTKGWKTTTAFELGYLDLWLKIGLFGMILYAIWIGGIWRRIARTPWANMFILSGLALAAVNLTSPYLNHPLGLGWLMLTTIYAYDPG
jgi:hypothetical protein